jgi:hypothetical protein
LKYYYMTGDVDELLWCFNEGKLDDFGGGYYSGGEGPFPDDSLKIVREPTDDEKACHKLHVGWEDCEGDPKLQNGELIGIAHVLHETGCGAMQPGDDEFPPDDLFVWRWEVVE